MGKSKRQLSMLAQKWPAAAPARHWPMRHVIAVISCRITGCISSKGEHNCRLPGQTQFPRGRVPQSNHYLKGESHMRIHFRLGLSILAAVCILASSVERAYGAVTITGVSGDKFLISGAPITITGTTNVVFKISFQNKTSGTNLVLCAGTIQDFNNRTCPTQVSGSGGPEFLTIVDSNTLNGKVLYVIRGVGSVNSTFVLTIE
jgi:hypothetical protein